MKYPHKWGYIHRYFSPIIIFNNSQETLDTAIILGSKGLAKLASYQIN